MALRQTLSKPFVVEPQADHTHTVVFLHRFPESVPDDQLPFKVLASKQTKDHKTLAEQFPSIRWVFPFAKTGARPYGNLSAADKAAVGLLPISMPYITQILLQEAKLVGGLDKVILGGQGETAVSAHEAMSSFPEWRPPAQSSTDAAHFLQKTFHTPSWTDVAKDPRLAGFVGMHAEGREPTRDTSSYSIAKKTPNNPPRINTSIVVNTPHCFIHGGYRVTTATWDGRRIDDFAKFLANDLGVHHLVDLVVDAPGGDDQLTPHDRGKKPEQPKDDGLNDVQKYALELARDKKENELLVEKIRRRIEADKVERKIRQERQRQARAAKELQARGAALERERNEGGDANSNATATPASESPTIVGENHSDEKENAEGEDAAYDGCTTGEDTSDGDDRYGSDCQYHQRPQKRLRIKKQAPGRRVAGDSTWDAPSTVRGQMSEAQMRAFGLLPKETESKQGDSMPVETSE